MQEQSWDIFTRQRRRVANSVRVQATDRGPEQVLDREQDLGLDRVLGQDWGPALAVAQAQRPPVA